MKKVLAILAVVAVVAVASVAHAQTSAVQVSGSISTTLGLTPCTVALGTITTSKSTATCTTDPVVTANTANGYNITLEFTTGTLLNTGESSDTIANLVDLTADDTCPTGPGATDCWAVGSVVVGSTPDPNFSAAADSFNDTEGNWGTDPEHPIPTGGAATIVDDGSSGDQTASGYDFDMTFSVVANNVDQEAGTYSNTGGTLTIAANP
ncbi:hypothetical protein ACFLZH_00735 [Patescibacteria group bacterium]